MASFFPHEDPETARQSVRGFMAMATAFVAGYVYNNSTGNSLKAFYIGAMIVAVYAAIEQRNKLTLGFRQAEHAVTGAAAAGGAIAIALPAFTDISNFKVAAATLVASVVGAGIGYATQRWVVNRPSAAASSHTP